MLPAPEPRFPNIMRIRPSPALMSKDTPSPSVPIDAGCLRTMHGGSEVCSSSRRINDEGSKNTGGRGRSAHAACAPSELDDSRLRRGRGGVGGGGARQVERRML